jgi:uncharacterized protein (TIGR02246 family)
MMTGTMKLTSTLALLVVASACSGTAGSANDTSKTVTPAGAPANDAATRAAIDSADQKFSAAFKAGDAATAASFYEDNATSMAPNMEAATGRAAIEKGYADNFKQIGKVNDFSGKATDVDIYPDHVIEVGTYDMSFTPAGAKDAMKDHGGYINYWRKQADGSWKIHRDAIVSAMPLPNMGPPAAPAKKK